MNDIEILEKLVIYWNSLINYTESDNIGVVSKWINTEGVVEKRDALRNLINKVKELENYKRKHSLIKSHYIPKSKIKEKIEELEKDEEFYREQDRIYEFEGKINILKQLLEEQED